jgi:hypothetical protein
VFVGAAPAALELDVLKADAVAVVPAPALVLPEPVVVWGGADMLALALLALLALLADDDDGPAETLAAFKVPHLFLMLLVQLDCACALFVLAAMQSW